MTFLEFYQNLIIVKVANIKSIPSKILKIAKQPISNKLSHYRIRDKANDFLYTLQKEVSSLQSMVLILVYVMFDMGCLKD